MSKTEEKKIPELQLKKNIITGPQGLLLLKKKKKKKKIKPPKDERMLFSIPSFTHPKVILNNITGGEDPMGEWGEGGIIIIIIINK